MYAFFDDIYYRKLEIEDIIRNHKISIKNFNEELDNLTDKNNYGWNHKIEDARATLKDIIKNHEITINLLRNEAEFYGITLQ